MCRLQKWRLKAAQTCRPISPCSRAADNRRTVEVLSDLHLQQRLRHFVAKSPVALTDHGSAGVWEQNKGEALSVSSELSCRHVWKLFSKHKTMWDDWAQQSSIKVKYTLKSQRWSGDKLENNSFLPVFTGWIMAERFMGEAYEPRWGFFSSFFHLDSGLHLHFRHWQITRVRVRS